MPVEECRAEFNEDKQELLKRYQTRLEGYLSRADLLNSLDMNVLQAFVIYLICGRHDEDGPDVDTLIGVAIGIAVKIGLHRDGVPLGFSPFEIEMRRRLWWQICILDVRTAEDHGSDPRILVSSFDTKFPLNVSDTDLDPDMSAPPLSRTGKTEMLFALVRFEVSNFARRILFSNKFCRENAYRILSSPEKCKAIDLFKERIETKYLSHCDWNLPLDFITAASCRLILVKLKLSVSKPQTRENQTVLMQENFRTICVEVLQCAQILRHYDKGKHWLWLFQIYIEWDALACLLVHLSLVPKGNGTAMAWKSVYETYNYWRSKTDHHRNHRWVQIEELHSQALVARDMVQTALTQRGTPSVDSDSWSHLNTTKLETQRHSSPMVSKYGNKQCTGQPLDPDSHGSKRPFELPMSRPTSQEEANKTAAAYTLSQPESFSTPADIPSSGTACQWSEGIFEQYFHILESEKNTSINL
ncbi:hypothetical protein N7474_000001 [Penicillium riverlandense]|uniref:uncharacterized protein n=1 Tax=Penicillium riverlandense TaxID=1903569 RepID=UPI0025479E76|nr:uncharacterized protein N7474_000001 [Penicillium riverlandense]KAJ5831690.1 hypothetical protein N7474_000001 [Penicillium riverlandense]